jgi:hypothetical protein
MGHYTDGPLGRFPALRPFRTEHLQDFKDFKSGHGKRGIRSVIKGQAPRARKLCSRCVLPDTFPGILFDERGVCQHCRKSEAGERRREQERARYREKFMDLLSPDSRSRKRACSDIAPDSSNRSWFPGGCKSCPSCREAPMAW